MTFTLPLANSTESAVTLSLRNGTGKAQPACVNRSLRHVEQYGACLTRQLLQALRRGCGDLRSSLQPVCPALNSHNDIGTFHGVNTKYTGANATIFTFPPARSICALPSVQLTRVFV